MAIFFKGMLCFYFLCPSRLVLGNTFTFMCCFDFVNYKCVSGDIIYMNVFTCTIKMGELMTFLFHKTNGSASDWLGGRWRKQFLFLDILSYFCSCHWDL